MSATVSCKWCGSPTTMTGTHECNNCWEIRCRTDLPPSLVADAGSLLDALEGMFEPAHFKGCLWLEDNRMPCQCGAVARIAAAERHAKALLRKHGRM